MTIGTGSATLATPTGLQLYFSGSELKLRWNEVTGAIYYNLYYSAVPGGPFTLLEKVFDSNIGDGTVRVDLDTQQKMWFYRVSAVN